MNVASEMGNGLTNEQCITKYDYLIKLGKVSIDKAEYLAAANTSDPGYVYDDDVVKAFNNRPKKMLTRKSRVWSTIMV